MASISTVGDKAKEVIEEGHPLFTTEHLSQIPLLYQNRAITRGNKTRLSRRMISQGMERAELAGLRAGTIQGTIKLLEEGVVRNPSYETSDNRALASFFLAVGRKINEA